MTRRQSIPAQKTATSTRTGSGSRNSVRSTCVVIAVAVRVIKHLSDAFDVFVGPGFGLAVGGWPSYVPVFRCAPRRTSYGGRRPPSGRPPRARWPVGEVASAPCAGVMVRNIKIKSASGGPAQRASGEAGRAGVRAWWGFTPWWLSPVGSLSSPGTGGDQGTCRGCNRRQGSWMLNLTFACCTPGRTPGRAAPARRGERPDLSRTTVRCARAGQWSRRLVPMELEDINSQLRVSRLARMVRVDPDVRDHVVASRFTSIASHSDEEPPCLSVGVFTSVFSDGPTNRTTAVADLAGNRMGPQAHDLVETGAPQRNCRATIWRPGDTRSCELISSSSDVKFHFRRRPPLPVRPVGVARG